MGPSVNQLLIILAIIILIFGAKKIPELAKGLGSGIKNFKKAVKEEDENAEIAQTSDANRANINATQSQNNTATHTTVNSANPAPENSAQKQASQNQTNPTQIS